MSFLYVEESATPMHVGGVSIFAAPAEGFDYDRLVDLISERIAFVPRYRQRVREIPGRLANPVWVDDEGFDVSYHVRRSALPRPGTDEQLGELVARVQSRPLDRSRPLWEVYLVEGLAGGRFAIVTKSHQALVDGIGAVDLGQVILDDAPGGNRRVADTWRPTPEPSAVELVAGAVVDAVRRPTAILEAVRAGLGDARRTVGRIGGVAGGLLAAATSAGRPAPYSPLNVEIGSQRRYAMVAHDLDDYRRIRKAFKDRSPDVSVHDVVLATITGALRAWLLTRGEGAGPGTTVRALVPISVRSDVDDVASATSGGHVSSHLVDLPVGEPSPAVRLHQVAYRMQTHTQAGTAVGARSLAGLAGFAPPTLHALGTRVAMDLSQRWFNLVVTNVPGPQQTLYADTARMLAAYPVVPLARRQALSIGLTSYDGKVFYGLNADRDAMSDLATLGQCFSDALPELTEAVI